MPGDDPLVLYIQLTLGPPHLARIRALDRRPGVRCRGVQLASGERTRGSTAAVGDDSIHSTLIDGEYESLPRYSIVRAALDHIAELGAAAIIVDAPADPVQLLIGRAVRRRGVLACTRWAATWADHPRHRFKEFLKGFVYRGWDAYFATGLRSIEYLRSFGVAEDLVFRCGNPVDQDAIVAKRAASPGVERTNGFLFVGRFLKLKNLIRFAHAYRRYLSEGGTWSLDLVGFGETRDEVERILCDEPRARFHGHLEHDELIPMYLAAGCLILPSYSENWGLVVNEAMHAALPIAISKITGCLPELLEEGGNGISFDPFDESSMVSALHTIEAWTSSERAQLGRRSLEIIAAHTPDAWAEAVHAGLTARGLR